ncbi:MAG: UDP-N-acetylmuramate dehydrogenase [Puniceicoccaceae bacterium]|nr:MAG: UDP-N-acetylmuramate dehydrogenase [Puniceicoccaceae bacterium]
MRGPHHFVGVAGMGMAPLARYLAAAGVAVSGEDDSLSGEAAGELAAAGVRVLPPGVLPAEAERVVFSSAVRPDHPTLRAAEAAGLAVLRRGELLAALARRHRFIAVAGSHGKTSTCALLIHLLDELKVPFGYILGGRFRDPFRAPGRLAEEGGWLLAEVDESDGTIGGFRPEITVLVNVDWDHSDRYPTREAAETAFAELLARTSGTAVVNAECEATARLLSRAGSTRVIRFGSGGEVTVEDRRDEPDGQALRMQTPLGRPEFFLPLRGGFNALNAAAALAAALRLANALPPAAAWKAFPGVHRRQALLHAGPGPLVMEDYAHHPGEIEALLESLAVDRASRLVVVFQPHRHSRTERFAAGFAAALANVGPLILMPVYGAGEPVPPSGGFGTLRKELERARAGRPFLVAEDSTTARNHLRNTTGEGDRILFLGAGDIAETARAFVAELRARFAGGDGAAAPELSAGADFREREPLGPKTTLKVGGPARFYAEPAHAGDLASLLRWAAGYGLPVHLLGRGSNLLVPDDGIDGLVVRLARPWWTRLVEMPRGRLWAGAGVRLVKLAGSACLQGWGGYEFLEGIPGTVGGALKMNAGAMGGWIFDLVEEVHVMTPAGAVRVLPRERIHFGYRHCLELGESIALGAVLGRPPRETPERIRSVLRDYQRRRRETQPREPSAGCIFKNPPGDSAGRLIDELGLKGERIGDAEVSRVHGNFIVNRGRATSAEVVALVRRIREQVRDRRGIELEPEVLLYGREWKEELEK